MIRPRLPHRSLFALSTALLLACGPQTPDAAAPATGTPTATPPSSAASAAPTATDAPDEGLATPRLLAAHGGSTCAVLAGDVVCWGASMSAFPPPDNKAPWLTPRRLPGVAGAVSVARGMGQSCALSAAGKVTCWGGDAPEEVAFGGKVTQIALGSTEEGDRVYGVLDTGAIEGVAVGSPDASGPIQTPPLRNVIALSAAHEYTCAVHRTGKVSCWGWSVELLGAGLDYQSTPSDKRDKLNGTPVFVSDLSDAIGVATSSDHACAVRKNGEVVCWGHNSSGELGIDRATPKKLTPVVVPGLADAVEVVAGEHHTCARRESGKVSCWGDNRDGQLGAGPGEIQGPAAVRGLEDARALAAGDSFSCALRASGDIACWGWQSRGRLGNGKMSEYTRPAPVAAVSGAVSVIAGKGFSCALGAKGRVSCWGLGDRAGADPSPSAATPKELPELGDVQSIWRADGGVCAVNAKGEARCAQRVGTRSLASLGKVRSILAGSKGGAALLASGQVVLFGWEKDPAKQADALVSVKVPGLADAVSIARYAGLGGEETVCAVRRSGKIACLQSRGFDRKAPPVVEVPDIGDAVALAAEVERMCAVRRTGAVDCFSTYDVRPSGDAQKAPPKVTLERIAGVDDAVQIVGPGEGMFGSACVLRKGGALACWGSNGHGQLGSGDMVSRRAATAVSDLGDAVSVAVGADHACAVKKAGEVLCWGDNTLGQAGQPAPARAFEPVAVLIH